MNSKEKLKEAHSLILEVIKELTTWEQSIKLMDNVADPLEEIINQWWES